MREALPLACGAIAICLKDDYGLKVDEVHALPLGADVDAAAYRVTTQGDALFLKCRHGAFDAATMTWEGSWSVCSPSGPLQRTRRGPLPARGADRGHFRLQDTGRRGGPRSALARAAAWIDAVAHCALARRWTRARAAVRLVLGVATATSTAAHATLEGASMKLEAQLLDLEARFWREGAEFYRHHLADDAVMVFAEPVGVLSREQAVQGVADAPRWADVRFGEVRLVQLTPSSVLLIYRAEASREGAASRYAALCSSAYVSRGEGWKLACHQQTPAAPWDGGSR